MSTLEWAFEIQDRMSSALDAMEKGLGALDKQLKQTSGALDKLEHESGSGKKGMLEGHTAALLERGALAEMAGVAMEAGEKIKELAEKVFELGKELFTTAVRSADFKRSALLALEATLGTKEAAGEELEALKRMSRGTKQTTEEMLASFQQLSAQGFGAKATEDILAAAADVGAVQGQGARDALLDVIRNAQSLGALTQRSLMGLKEVGAASPAKLIAVLAAQHRTTEAGVKKLIEAGKISSGEGINAILDLVQKNADKGDALGTMSKTVAAGDTATQVKNLKQSFEEIFENVDTTPLIHALQKLATMFDPNTAGGKKMADVLERAFGAVASAIGFVADNADLLADAFGFLLDAGSAVNAALKFVGEGAGDVVFAIVQFGEKVYGAASSIESFIENGLEALGRALTSLPGRALDAGANFVQGLIDGIAGGMGRLLGTVEGMGDSVVTSMRKVLGIHSPSAVMKELGAYTAQGFSLGFDSAPAPSLEGVMPSISMATRSGPAAASSTVSIGDIVVHVDGRDGQTGSDLGRDIASTVRAEIVRHFEGLAIEA